jgi:hypothetical protein
MTDEELLFLGPAAVLVAKLVIALEGGSVRWEKQSVFIKMPSHSRTILQSTPIHCNLYHGFQMQTY